MSGSHSPHDGVLWIQPEKTLKSNSSRVSVMLNRQSLCNVIYIKVHSSPGRFESHWNIKTFFYKTNFYITVCKPQCVIYTWDGLSWDMTLKLGWSIFFYFLVITRYAYQGHCSLEWWKSVFPFFFTKVSPGFPISIQYFRRFPPSKIKTKGLEHP